MAGMIRSYVLNSFFNWQNLSPTTTLLWAVWGLHFPPVCSLPGCKLQVLFAETIFQSIISPLTEGMNLSKLIVFLLVKPRISLECWFTHALLGGMCDSELSVPGLRGHNTLGGSPRALRSWQELTNLCPVLMEDGLVPLWLHLWAAITWVSLQPVESGVQVCKSTPIPWQSLRCFVFLFSLIRLLQHYLWLWSRPVQHSAPS